MMTPELLKAVLPKALQCNATQEFADLVNNLALDPEAAEVVRDNFLTYSNVLLEGKYKTEDYLNAVCYASHKLMDYSNQDAYIRTFPGRYQALAARGATPKDISAYVAAYHKNKLVTAILKQAAIPAWLLHQQAFNSAVSTQVELMANAQSELVRTQAANSILTHLKAPEAAKVELDVTLKRSDGLADLEATMRELAQRQQDLIQRGVGVGEVVRRGLVIEGEVTEVVPTRPTPEPVPVLSGPRADPGVLDAPLPAAAPAEITDGASPAVVGAHVEPAAPPSPPTAPTRATRPTLFPSLFAPFGDNA